MNVRQATTEGLSPAFHGEEPVKEAETGLTSVSDEAFLEPLQGWGMAVGGRAQIFRPDNKGDIRRAFGTCAASGSSVALRGAGRSYGDPALNHDQAVMDLSRMNRFLDFDSQTGRVVVEPGVTIRDLWRMSIRHGYWPAVVPGTMTVTVGGAAGMNLHGKNNFRAGTFGQHVRSFELMTLSGELLECSAEQNPELFHAAIGGFGMLGCLTRIELQLKKVISGRLRVSAITTANLVENLEAFEDHRDTADYLVSWIDCSAKGKGLGRGLIHRADHPEQGEDPEGEAMLSPEGQDVPSRVMGVVPSGWLWPGLWIALRIGTWPLVNTLKYYAGRREAAGAPYYQTHGAFHFLLDYIPNWKRALLPGGLIQFQPFVPAAAAERVLSQVLERFQKEKLVPYLGVLKRHRPDPFLMTHGLDGYSLALDFAVTKNNREKLWSLCQELADVVLEAGGRFYYAKDAILQSRHFEPIHGSEAVAKFRGLKAKYDPENRLQSDLWRRLSGTEC